MRTLLATMSIAALALSIPQQAPAESIDGRVLQIQLPAQDVTLYYVEAREVFTVLLKTKSASVEGQKLYIGDGEVAIDLVAHPTKGIFLQGIEYSQGTQFKNESTIKVRPGFKKASELKPGEIYVILPGVFFELAKK